MTRFLQTPDLPAGRARLCALAAGWRYIRNALEDLGVSTVETGPHPGLPAPLARHADLLLRHLGGSRVLAANGQPALEAELRGRGLAVTVSKALLSRTYPGDVALCGLVLGGRLYCHPEHAAPELLAAYPVVPVRQGYARCSVCIVDEGGVITADTGIAEAAERNGVCVLRIRPGHIELPGYGYGLIGGCSGLLAPDLLAFAGDLAQHPDGDRIRFFCRERGVEVLSLGTGPLTDIGGILPLREEAQRGTSSPGACAFQEERI